MKRHVHTAPDNAHLLPTQTNLQGDRRRSNHPTTPDKRTRRVSGTLYECLSDDINCKYRFPFGFGYFCSWMLKNKLSGFDQKPPCISGKESDHEE